MTQRFTIDRARPGEGSRVACLIAGSIPARLRPLTIWGSPRAGRYVESLLEGGSGDGQHEFYLLRRNAEPLGIAALRMMDGKAFLNHLYIAPEWRGRSLGARLLAEATAMYISDHCAGSVALDVFAGRSEVEAWYARLGFRERERHGWWLRPQWDRHPCLSASFDLTEANRQHSYWGFSSFNATIPEGQQYHVGRLYLPYFRLTETAAAKDPQLCQTLRALDPSRWLLLVATCPPPPGWRQIAVSRRLECPERSLCPSRRT